MADLDDIIRLAGINEFKGFQPYNIENISIFNLNKISEHSKLNEEESPYKQL